MNKIIELATEAANQAQKNLVDLLRVIKNQDEQIATLQKEIDHYREANLAKAESPKLKLKETNQVCPGCGENWFYGEIKGVKGMWCWGCEKRRASGNSD